MTAITAIKSFIVNVYLEAKRPDRRAIAVYRGDDISVVYKIRDRNGALLDLTGATATLELARRGYYGSAVQKEIGTGLTMGGAGGTITAAFNIDSDLVAGTYDDQLRITKDGKTFIATTGRWDVSQDFE